MTRTDDALFLPNPEELNDIPSIKDWMRKVNGILSSNQSDIKQDLDERIDTKGTQTVTGAKTFSNLKLSGDMDCKKHELLNLVIENRTSDPAYPVTGQIWLRVDLL